MEKPEITSADLAACTFSVWVSLAAIAGGAATYLICGMTLLDEIVSDAELA